jgi:hypothetical protein
MAGSKFLKGWVEQELAQILISPDKDVLLQNKRLYILNIFPKDRILLVTDSKVRMTILCTSQLDNEFMELEQNTVITPQNYFYSTLIQSSLLPYHGYFDHVGVGFPILMICSSFGISSGTIRKTTSWIEMNEVSCP